MVVFDVKSNSCMVCGSTKEITSHHGIPQVLKPQSNVVIPVCRLCHDKINKVDFGAVSSYLYKIHKVLDEKTKAVLGLRNIVEEYAKRSK